MTDVSLKPNTARRHIGFFSNIGWFMF